MRRLRAPRVGENFELASFERQLQATGFVHPVADFFESGGEKLFVEVVSILKREIQVLREAIGFEVAFLQTRSTLEHPARPDHRMRGDSGKEPAERVILFDDMRLQLQLGGERHDFLLRDHGRSSRTSMAGTQTRQAVARRSAGMAGSSLA